MLSLYVLSQLHSVMVYIYPIPSYTSSNVRYIFDNECDDFINATISQVVAGYLSGIIHLINTKEYTGLIFPDDLPQSIIKYQLPFLGDFIMTPCNLPTSNYKLESFLI